jgi:hypothetical protein
LTTSLPCNWQQILRNDENKKELFHFLSQPVSTVDSEQELFCIDGRSVVKKQFGSLNSLMPCDHEEADKRMMVHVKDTSSKGHDKIHIKTVDTDVVVLAIHVFMKLNIKDLWIIFGTSKNRSLSLSMRYPKAWVQSNVKLYQCFICILDVILHQLFME